MNYKISKSRGFTLVELMIVVAIIGILATLAIYGVRQYVNNAKTGEARNVIGRIAKDAAAAYNRDRVASAVLAPGANAGVLHALCGSAIPVPSAAPVQSKFQSSPADWGGTAIAGWQCLRFSMSEPQLYQYHYTVTGGGTAVNDNFVARAQGDLDGDGVLSTFDISGVLQSSNSQIDVYLSPTIAETNPLE